MHSDLFGGTRAGDGPRAGLAEGSGEGTAGPVVQSCSASRCCTRDGVRDGQPRAHRAGPRT